MAPVLEIKSLVKHFLFVTDGVILRKYKMLKAVDGVSFSVDKGACFGIAGESGSGKTTISRLILLLEKITSGKILYEGKDISKLARKDILWYRMRVQTIFQDAASSLNPRMRVRDIVSEPLEVQLGKTLTKKEIMERTEEMIRLVGLPTDKLANYPHELSGGQKQRVAIAKAVILHPALVILDEPVSALDVSIRAQILNLLSDIQAQQDLTYLIIAHDLAMLQHVTTDIGVMYLGKIVETGKTENVFNEPLHPYTKALFAAVPWPVPGRVKKAPSLKGEIGNPLDPPSGCRFHQRCEYAKRICREAEPLLVETRPGHSVACHKINEPLWRAS
ncbi:MAG: ABC transporter ATP-binding protein [Deltaproteobacteria bacterium]|nr:ABC transporter ATP-binding protein [Deltaproteobacteria bacterium]